jgi:hypothetical protein
VCLAAPPEGDDLRQRYISASVAVQCAAKEPDVWTDARLRARAVDKVLRAHGFSRASYAQEGFVYSQDPKVASDIRVGVARCRPTALSGRFVGAFEADGVSGTLNVRFRGRRVTGGVRLTMRGRTVRLSVRAGDVSGNRVLASGHVGDLGYVLVLTHRGEYVEGHLVLEDGMGTRTVPVRASLK